MKQLNFHADLAAAVVFVNGNPIALYGEIDISIKEPVKKESGNSVGWSLVTKSNVQAASCLTVPVQKENGNG